MEASRGESYEVVVQCPTNPQKHGAPSIEGAPNCVKSRGYAPPAMPPPNPARAGARIAPKNIVSGSENNLYVGEMWADSAP